MKIKIDKKILLKSFYNESTELNSALSQAGDSLEDDATSAITNNLGKIAAVTGVGAAGVVASKNMAVNRSANNARDIHKNMNSYSQRTTPVKNSTTRFGN
jgi:hypothetical protein